MALEQKLSLKLAQKLVMTPSLQQAIKLLQMTRMELETLLTQELVENPVLEESSEIQEEEPTREEIDREREQREVLEVAPNGEGLDHTQSMENIDLDAYFGDYWEGQGTMSMMEERDEPPIENSLTREPDLYDHLLWQLHMAELTPRQREIAELIIGNLNPDGFLVATPEEIRDMGQDEGREYTMEEVEEALAIVRAFDPPGIACVDLRESLLLQM
ncbi:MAG TPA: RNA polymerase sigma-54 factor, partial [Thermoanaerobaculia bacterium]|nr:RNA polymerase sigma-54 factor [Thermoanaerobaculia bacterium]